MSFLKILKLLLSLSSKVADYINKKQLMGAGAAKQSKENLEKAYELVKRADSARKSVTHTSDRMRNDKYNRDNR